MTPHPLNTLLYSLILFAYLSSYMHTPHINPDKLSSNSFQELYNSRILDKKMRKEEEMQH